jgi:hypothetical protein
VARVQSLAIPGFFGDGLLGEGLVGWACRRTPCAERAVMLPAVQSLRLLVRWVRRGAGGLEALANRVGLDMVESVQNGRWNSGRCYAKQMISIEHTFEILESDPRYSGPIRDQVVALRRHDGGLDVIAYFMLNSAYSITGSVVTSAMGTTRLVIQSESESGAACASVRFWQARFGFDSPGGMATNFEIVCRTPQ